MRLDSEECWRQKTFEAYERRKMKAKEQTRSVRVGCNLRSRGLQLAVGQGEGEVKWARRRRRARGEGAAWCSSIHKHSRQVHLRAICLFLASASHFSCAHSLSPAYPQAVLANSVLANTHFNPLAQAGTQINQQRCPVGAPPQWRPHLDAAGKAHLAPYVALASLKSLNLTPIQLTSSVGSSGASAFGAAGVGHRHHNAQLQQAPPQPPHLAYHPQNINNNGVNIEATFAVTKVLKKTGTMNLKAMQTIKLLYRVSAPLSLKVSELMTLANSNTNNNSEAHEQRQQQQQQHQTKSTTAHLYANNKPPCASELSELELVKKVSKIFKLNQNYVLFLAELTRTSSAPLQLQPLTQQYSSGKQKSNQQVGQWQQASSVASTQIYPFATHEQLTNQTSRALQRILCKNCAQVPQVQLLNSTFVSIAQQQREQQQQQQQQTQAQFVGYNNNNNNNNNNNAISGARIKLDCKVTGYPTPWIQWFKNGKLLRNKPGRREVRTSRWRKQHNVRLSRLELELESGANETGVYECRAMNVVAREPAVGTYTLLVLPAHHYALIPMPTLGGVQTSAPEQDQPPVQSQQQQQQPQSQPQSTQPPATPTRQPLEGAGGGKANVKAPAEELAPGSTTGATNSKLSGPVRAEETPRRSQGKSAPNEKQEPGAKRSSQASNSTLPQTSQPCAGEAHDNFCLNKGTCVLIGHIGEYFCNCAEGYYGLRCEYKSLGHQPAHQQAH